MINDTEDINCFQKSRNNNLQRRTFNLHKHRSLVKPMMITTTTGYIVAVYGPYLSDSTNNDAAIFNDILLKNRSDILNWISQDDILVVDRGFRDSSGVIETLGLNVCMPEFLNGRRSFDAIEGNRSRFVTKIRWVVESANGRVKQFRWFDKTIQNSTIPQIKDYFQIACSLINAFHRPLVTQSPDDNQTVVAMLQGLHKDNKLRTYLQNSNLSWKSCEVFDLTHFPILTLDYIRSITVGKGRMRVKLVYLSGKLMNSLHATTHRYISNQTSAIICRRACIYDRSQ